ncbi:ig-like domain-containing protein [Caerostris extrusa]|uniref:Ig-like domain-containing protein n=1 Tax=Caerostris extrusa TaxID=172846 RepID=A0AAV4Q6V1_CAEEX|nr:ig-like domain-containing protein [Caerostris extrusa]
MGNKKNSYSFRSSCGGGSGRGRAFIPCNVTNPLVDDEATLILWYRVDLPNPIYTLDVRNSAIKNARHFPSDEMEGRAKFNLTVHPPLLVLSDVTLEDEADYKCRVDLRGGQDAHPSSRLRVIGEKVVGTCLMGILLWP